MTMTIYLKSFFSTEINFIDSGSSSLQDETNIQLNAFRNCLCVASYDSKKIPFLSLWLLFLRTVSLNTYLTLRFEEIVSTVLIFSLGTLLSTIDILL